MSEIMPKIVPKIAVLVSGSGSNMTRLIEENIPIDCVIADRDCQATVVAAQHGIVTFQVSRSHCSDEVGKIFAERNIDLVVMAGFLSILKKSLTDTYQIVNIHPSLLPKYGGKGMYGMNVHRAVFASGDTVSGCTVHYVNAGVDTGDIIAQNEVDIAQANSAEAIAELVLRQEWQLLPRVVKQLIEEY